MTRYQRMLHAVRDLTGASHREAQLVWQRLGPWLQAHDRVSAAGVARHPKKAREYLALARGYVPPGWRVEISLRTKGGTYRRTVDGHTRRVKDPRPLTVKIIVVARMAMPIAEHERAVRHAVERGVLEPGFRLLYADWQKGKGRHVRSGRIRKDVARELVNFYGALHWPHTTVRAAMVEKE